ncbi:MAG: geranylgeranyl reductase family protein [Candidatus Altiarchaeota archaeon]
MKYDYAIIGGGPAGCIAAREAAKKGEVILFEEHKVQPVHCAGLISSSGFKTLGIRTGDFVLNEINGARFFSPLGTVVELRTKGVKAYVVDRSLFDGHLLDDALSKGVALENSSVSEIHHHTLYSGVKEFSADRITIATGTNYNLQKKTKLNCPEEFLVGAQYEMDVECERDMVELHFTVPDFFAWIIPLEDRARVGLCTRKNPMPFLNSFIAKLERGKRIKSRKILGRSFGIIPLYNPNLKTQFRNINLVGDAAGQVKATTGGGVVMGGIAAKYAHSEDYERLWRRDIGGELGLHLKIYRFISKLSDRNIDRLLKITSEGRSSLENHGDMDYASKTVRGLIQNPKFTLKLLLNTPSFILDMI